MGEWLLIGMGLLFGFIEIFWNWIAIMLAKLCDYTKNS